ncbi:MAG: hypothetical protein ACLQBY_02785 [Solirubrobacteraceae bacterium]
MSDPSTPSTSTLTPEFRAWLQREHQRGGRELEQIMGQRRLLLAHSHGLERFAIRMALVALTGSAVSWTKGVHDGLDEAGHAEAAATFAAGPPFAATDPTTDDCDQLGSYVQAHMRVLQDLLTRDVA